MFTRISTFRHKSGMREQQGKKQLQKIRKPKQIQSFQNKNNKKLQR